MGRQFVVEVVVAGGESGVDRAALDSALKLGIPHRGWCPQGRLAADGPIAEKYNLKETPNDDVKVRTEYNVRDSDATLIIVWEKLLPSGGTALAKELCQKYGRPTYLVDILNPTPYEDLGNWCEQNSIKVLNIVGPRESPKTPIYLPSRKWLQKALRKPDDEKDIEPEKTTSAKKSSTSRSVLPPGISCCNIL